MKLYSDEESDYICRDSRAVPLALRDQVFNLIMDDNHVSLFNPLGYQKRTYHTPTNVNLYSEAVSLQMGIEPAGFINEYNKRYDVWYKAMQDRKDRADNEYNNMTISDENDFLRSLKFSDYDEVTLNRLDVQVTPRPQKRMRKNECAKIPPTVSLIVIPTTILTTQRIPP